MFVLYLIILGLLLHGMKVNRAGIYDGYISKEQCNCVKGFFIVMVFCRHIYPYLAESGYDFSLLGDNIFRKIDASLGQLLVVMFLFYSGYGVMESIKRKGKKYVDDIPKKRVFVTLLNFDVAILIFIVVNLLIGQDYSMQNIMLAFTGWASIGNSNWYIFVILCCYISTYLTCMLFREKLVNKWHFWGGNVLIVALVHAILLSNKQMYWYDTIYSYPLGIVFSLYQKKMETFIPKRYGAILMLTIFAFVFFSCLHLNLKGMVANMRAVAFAMIVVLLSMKIQIDSKALSWLGRTLFPLYIYQRIGMVALSEFDGGEFVGKFPYMYLLLCVIIALFFGWSYRFIQIKIRK